MIYMIFSGRFDFHVQLAAPATSERGAILKHEIQKRLLECSEDILLDLAAKCEGYDAYDLVYVIVMLYMFWVHARSFVFIWEHTHDYLWLFPFLSFLFF